MSRALCALLLTLLIPGVSSAVPAITCHCFTDRSYDPARPALADPYFLATTQNAFFANAYGVDKKSIVIKKQQGVSAEDLWIAYGLASGTGREPETLLQERKVKGSWRQVAAAVKIPAGRFADGLKKNLADDQLAVAVVDDLLQRYRFYPEAELAVMRRDGAGNKELILAALLAARTGQPATRIWRLVKSGSDSWGGALQRAKLNSSAEIQSGLEQLMARAR